MKTNQIVCPKCGTKIQINGVDVKMSASNKNSKAAKRIEQMAAKGIDVSQFFAMVDFNGQETQVGVIIDNQVRVLPDDDDIVKVIISGGTLRTSHLFKQHVLAKMFKMLTKYNWRTRELKKDWKGEYYDFNSHFTDNLKAMGYEYQWQVLEDELYRQRAMVKHDDMDSFKEDNHWYNKELAIEMFNDYYQQFLQMVSFMKVRKCKGESYIELYGADRLLGSKKRSKYGYLYEDELLMLKNRLLHLGKIIIDANSVSDLCGAVHTFRANHVPLDQKSSSYQRYNRFRPTQCKLWVDCYKGYGAYFSIKNLIQFNGCVFYFQDKSHMDQHDSLQYLYTKTFECKCAGYELLGALKELLRDNNFDIEAKQKEWREKKMRSNRNW